MRPVWEAPTMNEVATHYYGRSGNLAKAIEEHLRGIGKDPGTVTTEDLEGIDQFHIGGRPVTLKVAAGMQLNGDSRVLDIGSGLGGRGPLPRCTDATSLASI